MQKLLLILFLSISFIVKGQKYTPTYLQGKVVKEDLKYLKEKITKIHPLFVDDKFYTEWKNQYDKIYSEIEDSLTFNESYIIFSSLLSKLNDGHSNLLFPYSERVKYMKNGGVTMPFTIQIIGNKIYIDKCFVENNRDSIIGAEVISINDITTKTMLSDLKVFYGAKSKSIINHNIEKYFGAYFWTFYNVFNHYSVIVKKENRQFILDLQPINNSQYFQLKKRLYPEENEKKYKLQFFNNKKWAYLKIKTFSEKTKLSIFLINTFDTIQKNKSKNLLIDLRNNFGGTSDCVDSLLSYLTKEEYRQYKAIKLRISDTIKVKYKMKDVRLYREIINKQGGQFFSYVDSLLVKKPQRRESIFCGNIYVLINENTYSAASTFAGVTKKFRLGKIIGATQTGGTIKYYGDFLFFKLPNSKMKFFISSKEFIQYGGCNLNQGVYPDIKIKKNSDLLKIIESITNANNVYAK